MRKITHTLLSAVVAALVLPGCGPKGEFDADGYKILHFEDEVFMARAIEQCDANLDGKLSIKEASDTHYISYNGGTAEGLNFDNAAGDYGKIKNIYEIHYFRYVQVLALGGNDLSGALDLEKLSKLRTLDLTGNTPGRLTKIIVNLATRGSLEVLADEEIEIEYYGYTGDDEEDPGDDDEEPGGGEEDPGDDDEEPGGGEEDPGDDDEEPDGGEEDDPDDGGDENPDDEE